LWRNGPAWAFALAAWSSTVCGQEALPPAGGEPSVAEALASEVRAVFQRASKAVVRIEATDEHGHLSGTGFFIDPNGALYTSYTIGGASWDIVVAHGAMKYPAKRVFADARGGVALLKVDAHTPFLALGSGRELKVGDPVMVFGYAMDFPLSPSFGCISSFDLKIGDRYFATRHIRAAVPVQRGQGGAPLVNMKGEAVGILISSLDQGSACFSLPIAAAEKARRDFIRYGELRPGWLGVEVSMGGDAEVGSTAEIGMLNLGAPGQKAGLRTGDVILQIGDHAVSSPEDVLNAAFFITAEDDVTLKIARDGQTMEVRATAVDRPNTNVRTAGDIPSFAPQGTSDLRGFRTLYDP
jgi:S1-C subfamily serine protease